MIDIVEFGYDRVFEYINEIICGFKEHRGQPCGWSQLAFEAVADGQEAAAIVDHRLYDWLYVEFVTVERSSRRCGLEW